MFFRKKIDEMTELKSKIDSQSVEINRLNVLLTQTNKLKSINCDKCALIMLDLNKTKAELNQKIDENNLISEKLKTFFKFYFK